MLEEKLNKIIENMSIEEKQKLLENIEIKHLGYNEKYDINFMNNITDLILDTFTLIAKILHII